MIPRPSPSRKSLPSALLLTGALLFTPLFGCSSDDTAPADYATDMATTPAADLSPAVTGHKIHATVAFMDDGQGVGVFAQNGVFAHIPKADLVGKQTAWIILKGGDQVANGKMLEVGGGAIDANLRSELTTKMSYADGPWELALIVMLVSTDLAKAPQPGDLASFDLTKPPAGEPPVTGTSVRVSLHGADSDLTLVNRYFIKL